MKKIIILLIMFFLGMSSSFALTYGGCEYSTVSRLKSLVSNVNISYTYHENDGVVYFDVTLNNLTNDMYFYDTITGKNYYYSDSNNGELVIRNYNYSGTYKFYSNIDACKGISIGSRYYKFPEYNNYYNDELCSDIPNFSLCQKWVKNNYPYDKFEALVNEYKSKKEEDKQVETPIEYSENWIDDIVNIYINYYYYFFIAIILVCSIVIVIKRRKDRFKL